MVENDESSNNTRDGEFKISITTEDIDRIVQYIKNDSKPFEEGIDTEDA